MRTAPPCIRPSHRRIPEIDGRDEQMLAGAIAPTRHFKRSGLDLPDVSKGFSTPSAQIPWGPALLAQIAERLSREAQLPVASSRNIHDPHKADRVAADGQMTLVMISRAHLANPQWPSPAALALGQIGLS
ncbi:hypothetical protein ACCQ10_06535 [Xanthomonas sp. NCPPB 1325]|uniref:hypothetical protein n=1 Tax=Xanthomonas sp. NCPPB 1325 TaxID=487529 RepID=UPI00355833FE